MIVWLKCAVIVLLVESWGPVQGHPPKEVRGSGNGQFAVPGAAYSGLTGHHHDHPSGPAGSASSSLSWTVDRGWSAPEVRDQIESIAPLQTDDWWRPSEGPPRRC